ncbi:M23 family metallopeptidase [Sphingomonas sp. BN140010]|uniref:M23 family metallopeptidase n=1 Tax=Sphingomonas arvum TaxID=2992113 RepID=A0ABT3JFJ7_9SPHN|nr:M23 family metallopeptidase [Sphingomonas sp. BN140010]MCW3797818.1 M23 family metallopeptidase [Sphingomonas sp. BN140010]
MFHSRVLPADAVPVFGLRAPPRAPFSLVVDLGGDLFSRRWWRGLGTLLALTGAVAALAPGLEPLAGGRTAEFDEPAAEQWDSVGIGALDGGAKTGLPMAETAAVKPLAEAPVRTSVALFATLGPGDTIGRLLARNGAGGADAAQVEALVHSAGRTLTPGTAVSFTLGLPLAGGARPVERVSLRAGLDLKLELAAGADGLTMTRVAIPVDRRPLRIRGRVGSGLYWSLRAAGANPAAAAQYLQALATQIEVGSEVGSEDRFTLVLESARAATGEQVTGPLLYAGLDRAVGSPLQLLRWRTGGQAQWLDAGNASDPRPRVSSGITWPVQAPITSTFGMRLHPILRFLRPHKGIDFGAHWGQPIVAAADGQVERAGWAGGYGQQVRIAHGGSLETSYSHMSRMVVAPGSAVRQGQLIGYVGTTGLSTGPHLHFETLRNGVAVNPMGVRFVHVAAVDPGQAAAIRARVRALLGA